MINTTTHKWKQLATITVAWLLIGLLMSVYDHLVLHTVNSKGIADSYTFTWSLLLNSISAFTGALFGGSILVFYVNTKFQDKPYVFTIAVVALSYILIITFIMMLIGCISVTIKTGKNMHDPVWSAAFTKFLCDTSRIKNIMAWSVVVGFTQLFLQISSKFGQNVFVNIMFGKYNTPKQENKIFMMLDLNSSTTIAEQFGNEKYHELLKDLFADVTMPIITNKGEIYQYVGDEVVVAWDYTEGLKNNRCVRCFFDIKAKIEAASGKYMRQYGLVPTFKAGIHCGNVVAGEVGIIKRDITYSGDVLNTAARILGMCKEFGAELIASADLVNKLRLAGEYTAQMLGSIKLRGKENEVLLSELRIMPLAQAAA
jgi:adenylate cyclase